MRTFMTLMQMIIITVMCDVYRVVNVEWHQVVIKAERKAGHKSQNKIAVICVVGNGKHVDPSTDEDDYGGYVINDSLFDMIRQCPEPYNDAFDLMENLDVDAFIFFD